MQTTATEVVIRFKRPPLGRALRSEQNYFRFRLGPDISIATGVRGDGSEGNRVDSCREFPGRRGRGDERLLSDAMRGDALLFVREDAVECSWAAVEHILGNVAPLHFYEQGSWGPLAAASWA